MPTGWVKKIAKQKHQSTGKVEKVWKKAEHKAEHEGYTGDSKYAVAMDIAKNMEHVHKKPK